MATRKSLHMSWRSSIKGSKNTLSALHRSLDEEVSCRLNMTTNLVQTCRGGKTVFYNFGRLGWTKNGRFQQQLLTLSWYNWRRRKMPRVAHEVFVDGWRWWVAVATFGQKLDLKKQQTMSLTETFYDSSWEWCTFVCLTQSWVGWCLSFVKTWVGSLHD